MLPGLRRTLPHTRRSCRWIQCISEGGLPPFAAAAAGSDAACCRRRFSLAADTEITLEVNPLTATPAALDAWRGLGVNRLSFGMQSAVDAELHRLGRRHTAAQGIAAVDRAAAAGFRISPVT